METIITELNFIDKAHQQALTELINGYIADEMGGGTLLDEAAQQSLIDGLKNHPRAVAVFALTKGVPSGIVVAFENFSTFTVSPMFNIHDVFVKSEFRGRGIGRMMMEKMAALAESRGCSRITLEVRHDNVPAQKLYQSLGFHETEPPMYFWRKYL